MNSAALPPVELLRQQAEWLAPARARLLRQAGIAHRQHLLDLGAGYGAVTDELVRRSSGSVVAVDVEWEALRQIETAVPLTANALNLPFAPDTFDLVFCQCVLMWIGDAATAVSEIKRVLQPGGVLVALEPDYGGLIEHPPEIVSRELWLSALTRLNADRFMGRKLPGILARAGFNVKVQLLDQLRTPADGRFDYLRTLPLSEPETEILNQIELVSKKLNQPEEQIAHLPFFLIQAARS